MKQPIFFFAALAVLAGCAAPGPANDATRAHARLTDPDGWQVVSVTPVPLGTGARAGDAGVVTSSTVVTNPGPVGGRTVYGAAPVNGAPIYGAPVYVPVPVYVQEPYWYPPVSIGLGFHFGKSWGAHRHRGYRRR